MKKILIIIIILVSVTTIVAGGFLSTKFLKDKSGPGTKEQSLTEKSKEEITKKIIIDTCKKQIKTEERDACFTGIAIYYKDQSLCEYIEKQEDKDTCQKNIEDYNEAIKETKKGLENIQGLEYQDYLKQIGEKISNMPKEQIENMSAEEYAKYMEQIYQEIIPSSNSEPTTTSGGSGRGGGGGVTEDAYELWEERLKENKPYVAEVQALSDNIKIEYSALLQYAMYLYGTEGTWSENAGKVMGRIDEIENENNISEQASQMIATVVAGDQALQSRVEERYNELLEQGL